MAKITFELNRDGVAQLLHSAEMERGLQDIARGIASSCGEGYSYDTKQMPTRVIASVYTETSEAALDNEQNNTILRHLQ